MTLRLRRCLRLTAPRPRRRSILSICRHHSPRQCAETDGGSCLVIATRRLLPGEGVGLVHTRSPPHPSLRSDADLLWPLSVLTLATGQVFTGTHAPKNGRQGRASPGPRGRRPVLTRGHSLRSCPLRAPFPPRLSSPDALTRSDQRPQFAGGRGLRSLPAVIADARPALTLTAVDCFPGPLRSGAAILTGDTPRPHRAGERGPVPTVDSIRRFRLRRRPFPCGTRRSRRGSSSAAHAAGNLHPSFAPTARQPSASRHCAARLGSGRHRGRFYFFADSPAASARIKSAAPHRASTASFSVSAWWRTRSAS